jgi:NAD(P)-dependent dehydrogenase (short-subunit alcohol dehydrogenase family)
VVVVTGASAGIGRALTLQLVDRKARVVAVARSAADLEELASGSGDALLPVQADVSDEASVQLVVDRVAQVHGRPDVVINNAAVGFLAPFLVSTPDAWRRTIDTNLVGVMLMTRAFLPAMLEARRGLVVNVGSTGAGGWPYLSVYSATKAGLEALTKALDREYASDGVRLICVEVSSTHSTRFGAGFDPRYLAQATQSWTELGLPWDRPRSPEESAGEILKIIEGHYGAYVAP